MPPAYQPDPFKPNYYVGPDALATDYGTVHHEYQPDPSKPNYYVGFDAVNANFDIGKELGVVPDWIQPGSPGGSLDTSQADMQRQNMQDLVAQLQQQAATGDGAWRGKFAQAVQAAKGNASALGQGAGAQARSGYAGSLRNIGNAQGAIGQRAVGQEQVLRNQAQNDAQGQLSDLLAAQGQGDIAQSASAAAVAQQARQANLALQEQATKTQGDLQGGITQAANSIFSKGGRVPGKPRVFGDDERNDTQPAMLSPGEIVVPRTAASDPDKAAAFARAVAQRGGARKLADGGQLDTPDTGTQLGIGAVSTFLPFLGPAARSAWMKGHGVGIADPTIGNGGILDTTNFEQTRGQMGQLAGQLGARAAGDNSVAGTINQQQNDAAFAQAVRAQNERRAVMGDVLQANAAEGSQNAGEAGGRAGAEQSKGQRALGALDTQRRAQELALAKAQQEAGWTNTMINHGISLGNQAALRNMLSSAGQAAAGLSTLGGRNFDAIDRGGGSDNGTDGGALGSDGVSPGAGDNDTGATDRGGGSDNGPDGGALGNGMAHGGRISFAHAVRMAEGGTVGPLAALFRRFTSQPAPAKPKHRIDPSIEEEEHDGPHAPASHQPRLKAPEQPKLPERTSPDTDERDLRELQVQRAHGGSIPGYAYGTPDGGAGAGAEASYNPYDPAALEPRRGTPPVVYVSTTPTPNSIPVDTGAGGGAPDTSAAAAGGGPGWYGPGTVAVKDMGSGGAEGGASGNEKAPNEVFAAQANAATAPPMKTLPPGIVPRGQELAPVAPTPEATAKPVARGTPAEKPVDTSAFDAEAEAMRQQGETKAQQARAEANALSAFQSQLQQNQLAQQEMLKRAHEDSSAMMTRYNEAVDEMKRIDTSVDPGRFWATRTTGQKVMGIIGMALSAVGSRDGTNKAAEMLGQAMDRDIDAQKANVNARLKKGEGALAAAQSAYAMNRQLFQDDLAATAATKASMLELADNQLKQIAATYSSPLAKQQAAQLSAQLQASKQKFIAQAQSQTVENNLKRAETAKAYAEAGKVGHAGVNPAEAKDLHTAEANAQDSLDLIRSIRGSLKSAQSSIPGKTAYNENLGEEAPALGTAATQLTLKLKDMAKLGQISTTDQALLDKLLGDPQAVWGQGSSESSKQARLTALEGIVLRSIKNQRRATLGVQAQ